MKWLIPLVLIGTTGCMTFGMDAEQLAAMSKIKDAACTKIVGLYMGGTVTIITVSVDKGIPPYGGAVVIKPDCETIINAEQKPAEPLRRRLQPSYERYEPGQ